MGTPWMPRAMRIAPPLDPGPKPGTVRRRSALLINPFYPKDPHASFGKHVLTPSLALTSLAASTPGDWEVRYWDESGAEPGMIVRRERMAVTWSQEDGDGPP